MSFAVDYLLRNHWAILPSHLELMVSIAEREGEWATRFEALEKSIGRPVAGTEGVTIRDGIAVVPVTGPLFRYANLMTMFCGATSYQMLALDLNRVANDPTVRAIMLDVDSPGGEVNGVSELAQLIRSIDAVKPVYAYIGGTGASGGYWLASAARQVFAADTAVIGSIGVMSSFVVDGEKAGRKTYSFVSSQSPLKNASPETEAGRVEIQRLIDDLAQVFVDSVAKYRGVSSKVVLSDFGQGTVFAGKDAKKRRMVDAIGTFEEVLQAL